MANQAAKKGDLGSLVDYEIVGEKSINRKYIHAMSVFDEYRDKGIKDDLQIYFAWNHWPRLLRSVRISGTAQILDEMVAREQVGLAKYFPLKEVKKALRISGTGLKEDKPRQVQLAQVLAYAERALEALEKFREKADYQTRTCPAVYLEQQQIDVPSDEKKVSYSLARLTDLYQAIIKDILATTSNFSELQTTNLDALFKPGKIISFPKISFGQVQQFPPYAYLSKAEDIDQKLFYKLIKKSLRERAVPARDFFQLTNDASEETVKQLNGLLKAAGLEINDVEINTEIPIEAIKKKSNTSLRAYLDEMGSMSMLSFEEVKAWAKQKDEAKKEFAHLLYSTSYGLAETIDQVLKRVHIHLNDKDYLENWRTQFGERFQGGQKNLEERIQSLKEKGAKRLSKESLTMGILKSVFNSMKSIYDEYRQYRQSGKEHQAARVGKQLLETNLRGFGKKISELQSTLELYEKAINKITQGNLRWVVSIAKKYRNRGLEFEELIQEGNLGLMKAAEKFDYQLGWKFSTFAYWWIMQGITRSLSNQARTVRLPVHMVEELNRFSKTVRQLEQNLGHKPNLEEIAAATGLAESEVRQFTRILKRPLSIDKPIGSSDDTSLSAFIEDEKADAEAMIFRAQLRDRLAEVMHNLTDREKVILQYRYGLIDGYDLTLEEIGKKFHLTRERVRQIEAKALRKLQHPARSKKLYSFVDEFRQERLESLINAEKRGKGEGVKKLFHNY